MKLEDSLRELVAISAERSAGDDETEALEKLANGDDEAEAAFAVILLRLRAGTYALQLQADLVRRLCDEQDLGGAMDAMHFTSAMATGFYTGARTVFSSFLADQ